jgi:hypothetical protein
MLADLSKQRPSNARRSFVALVDEAVARGLDLRDAVAEVQRTHPDAAREHARADSLPVARTMRMPAAKPASTPAGADAALLDAAKRLVAESGGAIELRDAIRTVSLTDTAAVAAYRERFDLAR